MKNVVFRDNNKKQVQFINTVLEAKHTIYVFGGAIRGGKTFVVIALLILLCKMFPGSRWTIVRKDLKRLKDNTRPSLNKFISGTGVKVNESAQTFTFSNGSMIMFRGENFDKDKTLEAFKGHETNGFVFEEVSEITEDMFNKGLERAGSYVIPNTPLDEQPPPMIFCTCNPTQGWFKERVYDKWKNNTLPSNTYYLPSYITDNAENLTKTYVESLKNLPKYEYEVFVLGNWDVVLKTKNAFWHALEMGKHVKFNEYDPNTTLHVSIDANVMPYCSATFWQVYPNKKKVVQVHEIAARDPYNHAGGLGEQVNEFLSSIEYTDILYIYGDATTKNQNAIDEKKRSFFDLFTEKVKEKNKILDMIGSKNPQIAKTGEFVNALMDGYDDWILIVHEICKESLSDYFSVKKDMDGTMQKTRIKDSDGNSYEEFGHFSDTMRYFLYECLNSVYHKWDNRFSDAPAFVPVEMDDADLFG